MCSLLEAGQCCVQVPFFFCPSRLILPYGPPCPGRWVCLDPIKWFLCFLASSWSSGEMTAGDLGRSGRLFPWCPLCGIPQVISLMEGQSTSQGGPLLTVLSSAKHSITQPQECDRLNYWPEFFVLPGSHIFCRDVTLQLLS